MQWLVRLFGWLLPSAQPKSYVRKFPSSASQIVSISASIVGTLHQSGGKQNEDSHGCIAADGKYAFYVVDGAGGEVNGKLASQAIASKIEEIMPDMLLKWNSEQEARAGLQDVLIVLNKVARDVHGMATLVLFVSFPSGEWALLKVGDAIFVGLDSTWNWLMPCAPLKISFKRNVTLLLGGEDNPSKLSPKFESGNIPFAAFFLASDWPCGANDNAMIMDVDPNSILGIYKPNQASLHWLENRLAPNGEVISSNELEQFLLAIQNEQVPEIAFSADDMTLIFGVIED